MTDRSHLTQVTAEITLDLPSAAVISIALQAAVESAQRNLAKSSTVASCKKHQAILENAQAAVDAFEPVWKAVVKPPIFTEEYRELIDRALCGASKED